MRKRRDSDAARAAARERPVVRTNQIFVWTIESFDERGCDTMLSGFDQDRFGWNRRRAAAIRVTRADADFPSHQCDTLAVDGNVDVFKSRVVTGRDRHGKHIFRVGRKHVIHDHAAARAEWRTVHVIPRMLRRGARLGVGPINRGRGTIADRHAADVGRGVEVRLEQCR